MEHKITFEIGEGDFEQAIGRKPKDEDEFEEFAHLCDNGVNAQIDWDIIYQCAKEEMLR